MEIKIMSRQNAIAYSYTTMKPKCVIISIFTPNDFKPIFYEGKNNIVKDVLYLSFNDIEGDIVTGKGTIMFKEPKQEDFNGLKDFVDKYKNLDIIVHCDAGISRSSAVAIAIHRYLKKDESWIWDSKSYFPNRKVLELCMNELGINKLDDYYNDMFM